MRNYDRAEVCELVGLFIIKSLSDKYDKDHVGLYRDDSLVLLNATSDPNALQIRQEKVLMHNQSVNFLDLVGGPSI